MQNLTDLEVREPSDDNDTDVMTLPPKVDDVAPKKPRRLVSGTTTRTKLKTRLQGAIGVVGKALTAFNEYDGKIVLTQAEELASALAQWADENDSVRRTLEAALTISTAGSVLGVCAAILIPILANHGIVPAHYAEAVGAEPVPNPERFEHHDDEVIDIPTGELYAHYETSVEA